MAKRKSSKPKASKAPKGESLLVELLTEELPPKSLARLSEAFAAGVVDGLRQKYFLGERTAAEPYATPRRLAVLVSDVCAKQPDRVVERKGPSVAAALDAGGKPTPALAGFARSCGVDPAKLTRRKDDKGEYFVFEAKQKGELLADHLADIVEAALKKLPVAKLMRWGSGDAQFVRPVHGLILLHGSKIVPGAVLGVKSGNKTLGHRFRSKGAIIVKRATDYEPTLNREGNVVASFAKRQTQIERELRRVARSVRADTYVLLGPNETIIRTGDEPIYSAENIVRKSYTELLEEVTGLVEWPIVCAGGFDQSFLSVPIECLAVSMQQHQKYFPLVHGAVKERLLPHFLFVSNGGQTGEIVRGAEKVLRARLSDAKFFYDQDRKERLESRVPRLAQVVYHNKLGSQRDRVDRIKLLAGDIARKIGADVAAAERAAELSKADLLTEMVGEFPELQGVMGRYYALHDGEPREVADAIEAHYLPRFAGDAVPQSNTAVAVALADKLDTLASMFAIGQRPTGDKDPFGLRRAAIGILRILCEPRMALTLQELLDSSIGRLSKSVFGNPSQQAQGSLKIELLSFMKERARNYLHEQGYSFLEVESVLEARIEPKPSEYMGRLVAVRKFCLSPKAPKLIESDKRARNMLSKSDVVGSEARESLLQVEAEKQLFTTVRQLRAQVSSLVKTGEFYNALLLASEIHAPLARFFDDVHVDTEDPNVRSNRLALLNESRDVTISVADISLLAA